MEKMILGIDIGTTSLKAAVFNQQGEQLAAAVVEYTLLTPGPQLVEAPCGVYMESVARCMDMIRAKGAVDTKCVQVVSFSVQGETLCLLDGAGEPLCNAIVWMDNRAGAEAECLPCLLTKWERRTATENTWPSPEAMAAPITPMSIGKTNSQSRKIFAPALTHIPAKDRAGEPSFRTKTGRQVLINMRMEKAQQ